MERAPKRRRPSLKKLYADLKAAPPNLASLELTAEGFKASFWPPVGELAPSATAPPAKAVPLVPGTPFPDDDSPINAIDLVLFPPAEGQPS